MYETASSNDGSRVSGLADEATREAEADGADAGNVAEVEKAGRATRCAARLVGAADISCSHNGPVTTADASTCGISANGYDQIVSTTVWERGMSCVHPTRQPEIAPIARRKTTVNPAATTRVENGSRVVDKLSTAT